MNIDELFKEGLLKKVHPSKEKAHKSIKAAENYLDKAKKAFNVRMDDVAILLSYSSVFHSARAMLFKDGISERSHFAITKYLKEKHPELGDDIIRTIDMYRRLRHSVSYGLDTMVGAKDSLKAIDFAESLLKKIKEEI